MIRDAFRFSFAVLRANGGVVLLLLATIYWPVGLLSAYLEHTFIDPDDGRTSMMIARLLDQVVYVVPDTAIYYVGLLHAAGEKPRFGESLCAGISCYGRMVVTRMLSYCSFLSLLLLVIPGLYWLSRWSMSEANVVHEGTYGAGAFCRSWQLTRERAWRVLAAIAVGGGVYLALVIAIIGLFTLAEDGWWTDGLASIVLSLLVPGWLLFKCGLYEQLTKAERVASGESA